MRCLLFFLLAVVGVVLGCAHQKDPYAGRLMEVEPQLVSGCTLVGVINETADAANPFPAVATKQMIYRIKARAVQLNATHMVWLHKTGLSGAAEAYRCPSP